MLCKIGIHKYDIRYVHQEGFFQHDHSVQAAVIMQCSECGKKKISSGTMTTYWVTPDQFSKQGDQNESTD